MRYQSIPSNLFVKNRLNFSRGMKANHIALFSSNDVQVTNADDSMGFAQNNDLFYLSMSVASSPSIGRSSPDM